MSATIELEKGALRDHVVTQIRGMTCIGCERKLGRVLCGIVGVHNVKTSLILGRAEFDIDARTSFDEIASLLEGQTEFSCVAIQGSHCLKILIPRENSAHAAEFRTRTAHAEHQSKKLLGSLVGPRYPTGVLNVRIMDRTGRDGMSRSVRKGFGPLVCLQTKQKSSPYRAEIFYDPYVVGARDLLAKGFDVPLSLVPLSSEQETSHETSHLRQTLYMTLLSAALTIPILVMAWAPLPPLKTTYDEISITLATIVQFIIVGPFYLRALRSLMFAGLIEMDLLIVLSTTTAYIYSVVNFVYERKGAPLASGGFCQTSTLLVTLIMVGRLASAHAHRKAAASISVQILQPLSAVLYEASKERLIDVREFHYGDVFKVLPDSVVPTDGIVISGETEIDESAITGEAVPVPKTTHSLVVAGSVNGPSPFLARLKTLPVENPISRIMCMVNEANSKKPKVQEIADRVAAYFVPCILALTFAVFSIWVSVALVGQHRSNADAVITALTYAIAVLVVSCPCAIGLAVPMVMVIAGGIGAEHGVIAKSPDALEKARKASHVVFDKTGTLTQGKFAVVEAIYRKNDPKRTKQIIKKLTSESKHPVPQALTAYLGCAGDSNIGFENISSLVGKGMQATLDGQLLQGGNPFYVEATDDPDVLHLLSKGLTIFCLRHGPDLLAIYGLRDTLHPRTETIISALQERGIIISIVSGDSITAVNQIATDLGVSLSHAKGQCSPEDKARYIESLSFTEAAIPPAHKKDKPDNNTTIFCGDGTNDAIALAQADIGINMAGGTDVAKSAADVILTRPSLEGVLTLIDLSHAVMRRVRLNFAWCVVYNVLAIMLAAGAFVSVRIPPAYAGLGELVSVLPVLVVAVSLRWTKVPKK